MVNEIEIIITTPNDENVIPLIEELSVNLGNRFGSDGKNSFQELENMNSKFVFVKACKNLETIGCGAIRPITENIAELKRMFSKYKRLGIGEKVLNYLENKAKELDYKEIRLETRKLNQEACAFYLKNGYNEISNYGENVGNEKAICFGKLLTNEKTKNS